MSANFQFVKDLYNLECRKPIKMAFKLNDRCLNPQPIERVNVNLAASVFDESTINAMQWYSEHGYLGLSSTVNFMTLVRKWWLKANVKTLYAFQAKRDVDRVAINSDNLEQLNFFQELTDFLDNWFVKRNLFLLKAILYSHAKTNKIFVERERYFVHLNLAFAI